METILMVFNMTLVKWVNVCKFLFNFMAFHVKHHKNVYIYFRRLEKLLLCGATQPEDTVWVYDKFRNVCGICENAGLKQVVMNFGKFASSKKKQKVKHIFRPPLRRTDLQQKDLSLCISKESDQQYSCSASQKWWVCSQSRLVNGECPFSNVQIQFLFIFILHHSDKC